MMEPSYEQALKTLEKTFQGPHQASLWGDGGEFRCPGFGPAAARPGGGAAGEGGRALLHTAGRGGRRHVARTRRGGGEAAGPLRSDARRPAAQSRRRMGRSRARDAVAQAGRRAASQRHGSRGLSHECPSRYRRGWLATDGLGVGSFEFGRLRENVLSASVVLPGGERREVPGEEVGSFLSTGTAEGIVVGARLRTRRADADTPLAAAFEVAADMTGAVTGLFDTSLPLWHLAVLNPAMARARKLGTMHLMFGAYPRERTEKVENRLRSVVESNQGRLLPAADAHRAWGERYFPIRPSILPPGFPGLSREFSSVAELPQKLEQVEDSATSVALQGTIARSGEILLLTLDTREMT
jgi:hypothetical protein